MSLTQLNPTIWLETPIGVGLCHFVIDYGEEHDLLWVVADDASGEIWTWPNPQVRFIKNISLQAPRNGERKADNGKR
jgi:hypothetical protein